MPFQPVDEPGQCALAEVHCLGQALRPIGVARLANKVIEQFEVAHTEPVQLAELALQGVPRRDLGGDEHAPRGLHRFIVIPGRRHAVWRFPGPRLGGHVRCHARILVCSPSGCKYINCTCNKCTYMHIVWPWLLPEASGLRSPPPRKPPRARSCGGPSSFPAVRCCSTASTGRGAAWPSRLSEARCT